MFLQWKKPAYSRPGKPFSACLQPRGKTRPEKGTRGVERGMYAACVRFDKEGRMLRVPREYAVTE